MLLTNLSGCTIGPAPYAPRADGNSYGYSDERLADNRFRVTYVGTVSTPRDVVENYLLFRSAQVTEAAGFSAFLFDARDTKSHTTYFTDVEGFGGYPHRHFGWYWDPFPDVEASRPVTRYEAYAEIVMLTTEQAKAEPRALGAHDVIDRLGPQ
ncbi:MAG TPA: hypothetical protein VIJ85_06650, partial [Rhizomicrobium sp.]